MSPFPLHPYPHTSRYFSLQEERIRGTIGDCGEEGRGGEVLSFKLVRLEWFIVQGVHQRVCWGRISATGSIVMKPASERLAPSKRVPIALQDFHQLLIRHWKCWVFSPVSHINEHAHQGICHYSNVPSEPLMEALIAV